MAAAGVGVSPGSDPGTNEQALEAFKLMLDLGGDISTADTLGDTALHGAARRGANAIVQLLVDRGADLEATNDKGWTPLTIAAGVSGVVFLQPHTAALLRRLMEARAPQYDDTDRSLSNLRPRRLHFVVHPHTAALRRRLMEARGRCQLNERGAILPGEAGRRPVVTPPAGRTRRACCLHSGGAQVCSWRSSPCRCSRPRTADRRRRT